MSDDPRPPRERFRIAAALESQLDTDLLDSAERYAGKRCVMLEHAGLSADAAELVHDAIEATLSGERTWDPDRYSLYHHLCGVIGSRTAVMLKHARRFPKVRMGGGERDDATDPIETAAALQQEQETPEAQLMQAERVSKTVDALRAMAEEKNDQQVLGILKAFGEGITERAAVASHLGISVRKYDNARARMLHMARRLESEGDGNA